jgi:hypothetical protein
MMQKAICPVLWRGPAYHHLRLAIFAAVLMRKSEQLFDGFVAYFGTYSFNLSAGMVIHHVRSASFPNWTGTEQVRYFKAEGQRLVLSTPISDGGRHLTAILIWERARDR